MWNLFFEKVFDIISNIFKKSPSNKDEKSSRNRVENIKNSKNKIRGKNNKVQIGDKYSDEKGDNS